MRYLRYKLTHPSVAALAARSDIVGLVWALANPDEQTHKEAIEILSQMGEQAVPVLSRVVSDRREDWLRRKNAAVALGRMSCPLDPSVFLNTLNDPDRNVQQGAVWAIGNLRVKQAVPALKDLVLGGDASWYTRAGVVEALGKIGSPEAERVLTEFKARIDELHRSLITGARTADLEALYATVLRRHTALGESPVGFDDMRGVMASWLLQLKDACEKALKR